MAEVTLEDIKKLRAETGAGFMDCKKALQEAGGDFQKAIEILRKRGREVMKLKAGRKTEEGAVFLLLHESRTAGAGAVLHCETDFVAMNEEFRKVLEQIVRTILEKRITDRKVLLQTHLSGDSITVEEKLAELVGKIGENIQLGNIAYLEGPYVHAYLHFNRRVGTLVAFNQKPDREEVAENIALHITASAPLAIQKEDLPQELVEKEREILRERTLQEGKPEHIVDRIVEGRLRKFFEEKVLMLQPFFANEKISVGEYLQKEAPGLEVVQFVRLTVEKDHA